MTAVTTEIAPPGVIVIIAKLLRSTDRHSSSPLKRRTLFTITSVSTWNLIFEKLRENRAELVGKTSVCLKSLCQKAKGEPGGSPSC
jgi:hypothetical protein